MKVMLIDGGARGHALALAYLQDSSVQEVLVAPGNDGMCFNQLYGFAKRKNILIDSSVNLKKPETVPAATLALAQQYNQTSLKSHRMMRLLPVRSMLSRKSAFVSSVQRKQLRKLNGTKHGRVNS